MRKFETALPGCLVIEPDVHGDARGWFYESFHQAKFRELLGQDLTFVQSNVSRSLRGVVLLLVSMPNDDRLIDSLDFIICE